MSKRQFDENDGDLLEKKFFKKDLDSDDDDDDDDLDSGKKYEILKEDDIEGQEAGVVTTDGDVQITPFNMKEEMEEGHFDSEGMYHWNKGSEIRDGWLENIDWIKIKTSEETSKRKEDSDEEEAPFDEIENYKQVLTYMKEKESVAATLRRLGGSKSLSASERLKRKKAGLAYASDEKENKEAVTKVTELADAILSRTGNMNIYQETFEEISGKINKADEKKTKGTYAADLDMYADDFGEKEQKELTQASTSKVNGNATSSGDNDDQEVKWEFKRSLDTETVEGPFSTEQMNKWMHENYFKEQVWIRKYGSSNEFYSSKRMDFELYL